MTDGPLVTVTKSLEERVADLEKQMRDLLSDHRSHEYLGDAHFDDALRGLVRAIVRDGYATMDTLGNDPSMAKFLTDSNWLKTYFRQQFTEDRRDPMFACDDPAYRLVSFSFAARYDVFCVTFKSWLACAIRTATHRYLSSDRSAGRRNLAVRSVAGANGIPLKDGYLPFCEVEEHHSCDGRRGQLAPNAADPEPFVARFRRVAMGPRKGGRPRSDA